MLERSGFDISDALNLDAGDIGAGDAIRKAAVSLMSRQNREGFWWADLRADSTLESDYIMMELWLHPPVDGVWNPPTRSKIERAVAAILARQLEDGGFNIYREGPAEVNASIKAYFALKVAGVPASDPRMLRLRDRILELGGLQAANSYVRINLGLFNLFPREACPSIPPETILLPFHFIYQMSSWTRAIVIPLSMVHSSNPRRPVPAGFTLEELYLPGAPMHLERDLGLFSWRNCFLAFDRFLKVWERVGPRFIRRYALAKCSEWMIRHFEKSDGLGAIYPSMQYAVMALDVLGFEASHPYRVEAEKQFNGLMVDLDIGTPLAASTCSLVFRPFGTRRSRLLPWPKWKIRRLQHCAAPPIGCFRKKYAVEGDWSVKRPGVEPSGWAFEFNNEFYPDIDDTAMVLLAFAKARASDESKQRACEKRALNWLLAMQGKDGGWAAFDVDNNWDILSHVPFADHNAMLDPSCPDITGRVLEALIRAGPPFLASAVEPGSGLSAAHARARWKLVRALGCELYLRYVFGTARLARRRLERE